ncbi:MAG: undecaprenyl-diphosphatase, partial [Candidatus Levybacteria bacterium]|nr:undecaprenyl-diphosphatase [Candidatus Levybacteria bacterium]
MTYLHAAILSIVEGISEFLPISSTGHLILTADLLKIAQTDFVKSFEIIIQLGAIAAVVLLYWRTLTTSKLVWSRILIAFLPTAIVGFILYKSIKSYLIGNTLITLAALLFGGIMLIALELHLSFPRKRESL